MRRPLRLLLPAILPLMLAACGTQSITMNINFMGTGMSIVASGSQSAIDKAKAQINKDLAGGSSSSADVKIVDGDQHQGDKICETDVTDQGDTYHIVVYSTSKDIPPSVCSDMKSSGG